MILAGDVGATKSVLALFSSEKGTGDACDERTYPNDNYPSLEGILEDYLSEEPNTREIVGACLGIAAPMFGGKTRMTNLPWTVDNDRLERVLGGIPVATLNDLEATGYGIATLEREELAPLQAGRPQQGNAALIAAGTGLGEAILFWDEEAGRHIPLASEGGHADFAPRNALEIALLEYLIGQFDHVSYERVVAGQGLVNIYRFLRDSGRGREPGWLAETLAQEEVDAAAIISEAALQGRSQLCEQALDLFVTIYGAEAGNLALKALAAGGVYIGGGIAPKIHDKLKDGAFMRAFLAKGRYRTYLEEMPVRLILNPKTALQGAAHYALIQAGLV